MPYGIIASTWIHVHSPDENGNNALIGEAPANGCAYVNAEYRQNAHVRVHSGEDHVAHKRTEQLQCNNYVFF